MGRQLRWVSTVKICWRDARTYHRVVQLTSPTVSRCCGSCNRRILFKSRFSLGLNQLLCERVECEGQNERYSPEKGTMISEISTTLLDGSFSYGDITHILLVWNSNCTQPSAPLLAESIASNSSKEPDSRRKEFHFVWPIAELRAKSAESLVAVANIET